MKNFYFKIIVITSLVVLSSALSGCLSSKINDAMDNTMREAYKGTQTQVLAGVDEVINGPKGKVLTRTYKVRVRRETIIRVYEDHNYSYFGETFDLIDNYAWGQLTLWKETIPTKTGEGVEIILLSTGKSCDTGDMIQIIKDLNLRPATLLELSALTEQKRAFIEARPVATLLGFFDEINNGVFFVWNNELRWCKGFQRGGTKDWPAICWFAAVKKD